MLSQITRQIIYALLTRAPLSSPRRMNHVRLACVRHAASVRSEPGSNSPVCTEKFESFSRFSNELLKEPTTYGVYYLVFKDQARCPFRLRQNQHSIRFVSSRQLLFSSGNFFRKSSWSPLLPSCSAKRQNLHASLSAVNRFFLLRFFFQKSFWSPLPPNHSVSRRN